MLTDLRLQHFRSYSDDSFEFQPGVNIIVGPNASGKTNLLEAILMLAIGGSYRAKDLELIEFGKSWARLDADLDNASHRTLKLELNPELSKSYEFDTRVYKRLSLTHTLPVVLFEPDHLRLLTGSPEQRRLYLDDLLEQTKSGYGTLRRQYRRTLQQRNALLKQEPADNQQLFAWNIRLSQLGGQIVKARTELSVEIDSLLPTLYRALGGAKSDVRITYQSRWPAEGYESNLLKKLEDSWRLDQIRGFTSAGPHREDVILTYNDRPANETASRGEIRTSVLALKIIELRILEVARQEPPLLLLDDVFSELDGARRRALTEHLQPYQTFITTTDADLVLGHFTTTTNVIAIQHD